MGWKSTIDITRSEAISAIEKVLSSEKYDEMSNSDIEEIMYKLGIGEDNGKPYFGYNFNVRGKYE